MEKVIKNPLFWLVIYGVITTAVIIILSIKLNSHVCPAKEIPVLDQKAQEQIKEIYGIENKSELDSLLIELYGFKSK